MTAPSARWILVVDDEADIRGLLVRLLARYGFAVREARDGAEAIQILESCEADPPALVLTDLCLPTLTGAALARYVAKRFPRLPVMLMSGFYADLVSMDEVSAHGWILLQKPFTTGQLERALARTFEQGLS
jgi:DNA-binding NtrC family response regulator